MGGLGFNGLPPEARAFWLRSLLRCIGRFRPGIIDVRWLAVWGGWLDGTEDRSVTDVFSDRFAVPGPFWDLSDHVGRLLGAALHEGHWASDDVFETLSLIAEGRHPIGRFGSHVARALAHAANNEATARLVDVVLRQSDTSRSEESSRDLLGYCIVAGMEGLVDRPSDLAEWLNAVARVGRDGVTLPWNLIASIVLPLPVGTSTQGNGDPKLAAVETFADLLRDAPRRQLAIRRDDPLDMMIALSVEAAIDPAAVDSAAGQIRDHGSWDRSQTLVTLVTLGHLWDPPSVEPLWKRLVRACVDASVTDELLRQTLLMSRAGCLDVDASPPDGSAFDALLAIAHRVLAGGTPKRCNPGAS